MSARIMYKLSAWTYDIQLEWSFPDQCYRLAEGTLEQQFNDGRDM